MSVDAFLTSLRTDPELKDQVAGWIVRPGRSGAWADFPDAVPEALRALLRRRGIERLYSHQAEACARASRGEHCLIVTPTASGKSLAYNLPVVSSILRAREQGGSERPTALYLFPTKALSQDQTAELHGLAEGLGHAVAAHTYDGDTPPDERRIARDACDVLVTNPYMLHVGILPNHARWVQFFRRLRYVVIDELHVYKGVFGSSVANVLRRLKRVAARHGGRPTFIGCSATIRDPEKHFEKLIEETPAVVDRNGAPAAERHYVFYNPPVVVPALGIRARAVDHVRTLGRRLLAQGVPSIFFGRSRSVVETTVKYLKDAADELRLPPDAVVGYRGGYLPDLRRRIERGLRAGEIRSVAATNALELGVDIGALDVVVMQGYPGSSSSFHQQAGRAGRRSGTSAVVLVATSTPLDQFVLSDPERLVNGRNEATVIHPDNLVVLAHHLKCAAFELPFRKGDAFGRSADAGKLLEFLAGEGGVLLERDGRYHWMAEAYPAQDVPLDFADSDTFTVLDAETHASLGLVHRAAASTTIHEDAIYQHQGEQYHVEKLDWEGRRAYARRAQIDYYTDADTETDVQVLVEDARASHLLALEGRGDVHVTTLATLFKRIRFYTHENLDSGVIKLPPEEVDTTAFWAALSDETVRRARLGDTTRYGALPGAAYVMKGVAPMFLRCAPGDLRAKGEILNTHFERPTILLFDAVAGGLGLAEQLFERRKEIYRAAADVVERCPCVVGCPACIGLNRGGRPAKEAALDVLRLLAAAAGSATETIAAAAAEPA
ncbi:MAG TPA: DEAD/DEAH box helicase [Planctomycetota bacterium]|nr:DEAD/DEAH box helicase [Planctomycetota bacterium]